MFQSVPETQYLLITVIDIEAKQYAMIESPGLFVMLEGNAMELVALGDLGTMKGSRWDDGEALKFRISISSFFLSSMIAGLYARQWKLK